MRMPFLAALSVVTSASAAFAQSPPRAQTPSSRCAPQVEATAAVAALTVARLTAALSSGTSPVAGACPRVRLDVVNARLVMTVVLEDGRQVARVLPTQHDALPTLVALTATLSISSENTTEETIDTPPPEAPAPNPRLAFTAAAPTVALQAPTVLEPVASRRWSLRLGASMGTAFRGPSSAPQGGLALDLLLPRWAFGLEGTYARAPHGVASSEGLAASVRWRWSAGRWQFEAGPSLGVIRTSALGAEPRLGMRAGAVTSLGFLLLPSVSIFVRAEAGAERASGRPTQFREPRDAMDSYYAASAGLRWEFLR